MSAFLFSFFLIITSQAQFQPFPIKSVKLTPNNPSEDYAHIIILDPPSVNENFITNQWEFDIQTNLGWQMAISLDKQWGFHSIQDTTIRVTINGGCETFECKLVIAFSVDDYQYIATKLCMDNVFTNKISPSCSNPDSMFQGDNVSQIINDPDTKRWPQVRQGIFYELFAEDQLAEGEYFPIQFALENYPTEDTFWLTHYNPTWTVDQFEQSCYFQPMFPTEKGVDVYIGGDDIGEKYIFESIDIELEYQLTYPPTNNPSDFPTKTPVTAAPITSIPTEVPITSIPTAAPSTSVPTEVPITSSPITTAPVTQTPTNIPTMNPTLFPTTSVPITAAPVTSAPTTLPVTQQPITQSPTTYSPTLYPITSAPITESPVTNVPVTLSPVTSNPTVDMSTTLETDSGSVVAGETTRVADSFSTVYGFSNFETDNVLDDMLVAIMIVAVISIIIIICCIFGICFYKKKKQESKELSTIDRIKSESTLGNRDDIPKNGVSAETLNNENVMTPQYHSIPMVSMQTPIATVNTADILPAILGNDSNDNNEGDDDDDGDEMYTFEKTVGEGDGTDNIELIKQQTKGNDVQQVNNDVDNTNNNDSESDGMYDKPDIVPVVTKGNNINS